MDRARGLEESAQHLRLPRCKPHVCFCQYFTIHIKVKHTQDWSIMDLNIKDLLLYAHLVEKGNPKVIMM